MLPRLVKIPKSYSFFLFGPRGVGKTTLLQSVLPKEKTAFFDLLNYETETQFLSRPGAFAETLGALPSEIKWVVIDEVQKIPFLLNEVHRQIEKNHNRFFALTGSSARKLKRGQANLLAGRAFVYTMAPLTSIELKNAFMLDEALSFGTLPKIFSFEQEEDKKHYLRTYAETYMREEIQMEGLLRKLESFRRFLPLAAQANGQILSWSNFAQDVGIDTKTIQSYFQILEDTLLGSFLHAYHRSIRKRQKTHPKFYLFDTGVKRSLAGELNIPLLRSTYEYGRAFEHFWILELMRMNDYLQSDFRFSYLATNDIEIDLVVERPGKPLLFVEIKSRESVKKSELRPLMSVVKDVKNSEGFCISKEPRAQKVENILVLPWQEALKNIFHFPSL